MSLARCTTAIAIVAIAACSSGSEPKPVPPPTAPMDAGMDGVTALGGFDPNAHLDEIDPSDAPARPSRRPGRPIEIVLRSTPTGARVQVDGVNIGQTPTFWAGETGVEHQFTFTLDAHATAHYKFWPITTGTLHARLDPVADGAAAARKPAASGAPPPKQIPAPTTILSPDAGVPKVVPPPIDAATAIAPSPPDAAIAPAILDAAIGLGPQP